jgi:virginiamycin B lyase
VSPSRFTASHLLAGSLLLAGVAAMLVTPLASNAQQSDSSQGIQANVATQVSWGSANGCEQNIPSNDFGVLTPSATAPILGSFSALPASEASTNSSGQKVWVGCITTNATLTSVSAQGTADMRSGPASLGLSNVSIGLTNATGGQINGGSARCAITAGQATADACTLPTGGRSDTLISDADAGTTELDWQYQLDLPANQPIGTYAGGQVTFTATADESAGEPAGTITEYLMNPGASAYGLTAGPDGNLWFTDDNLNKIGKITTSGQITEYPLVGGSGLREIATGPDGDLWFTEHSGRIGKITTSGQITQYSLPSHSEPIGITAGPEGDMWYTVGGASKIGKITPSGTTTEYPIAGGGTPYAIAVGPDGNLWFTEWLTANTARIGKMTPAGTVTEYHLPSPSLPYIITAGPDGNLWFTNFERGRIGKITTSGQITEYGGGDGPYGITVGPDGNLWYTDRLSDKIGKITTAGASTEYPLRIHESDPYTIIAGPDGDVWFAEDTAGRIAKIVP